MALYSDKVMDHFQNPRNVGKIEDADGIGMISFVEEHGGKLYCLLHSATITDDPLSWTQRYTRQRTVLLMKDLQTGKVTVLYSC